MYMRELETAVFDEGRVVTFATLSREKCMPYEDAKQALIDFKDKHGDAVFALHLVSGYANGAYCFKLADDASLPAVRETMSAPVISHIYSLTNRRPTDPAGVLASTVLSQATSLCSATTPAGDYYRRNKGSAVLFSTTDHVAASALVAVRSATAAPTGGLKTAGVAPPPPAPLRKAASVSEQPTLVQPAPPAAKPPTTSPASAPPKAAPSSVAPVAPASKSEAGKSGKPSKPAPKPSGGGFFGGFLAQVQSMSAKETVSPSILPPATTSPKDAIVDSEEEAEFGAHLPSVASSVRRVEPAMSSNKRVRSPSPALPPPATVHRPVSPRPEAMEADAPMDSGYSPIEQDGAVPDSMDVPMEPLTQPLGGPIVGKKKVLVDKTYEDADGFTVTEQVWEEVDVDVPAVIPAPSGGGGKPATPAPATRVVATPKAGAPATPASDLKKPAAPAKRKGKAEAVGGPKQATMTAFFMKK